MPQLKTDISPVEESRPDFESSYLAVRTLEGRVYTDEEVKRLPEIAPAHQHYKEWLMRRKSAKWLVNYLGKKKKPLGILEVGCGNGWLAAQLAQIRNAHVFALDVNRVEVQQAKRVFNGKNLQFFAGSFDEQRFKGLQFDIIVFAAAIQYFPSLGETLEKMTRYLADDGEIHLIDSNFYTPFTVKDAAERTQQYYTAMQYPEMAAHYYHHRLDELEGFNHRILKRPAGLFSRLLKGNPFYWIKINKSA